MSWIVLPWTISWSELRMTMTWLLHLRSTISVTLINKNVKLPFVLVFFLDVFRLLDVDGVTGVVLFCSSDGPDAVLHGVLA
jgi:hypothetical protein